MSYVVTAIAQASKFPAGTNEAVLSTIKKLPLKVINVSPLSHNKATDFIVDLDILKTGKPNAEQSYVEELAATIPGLLKKEKVEGVDLIFQANNDARKHKKLAVFDMDSTLIQQEVIEIIAKRAGVEEEVAQITKRAMNGELDFIESFKRRVSLLKGIDAGNLWSETVTEITYTPGAKELCKFLKSQGFTLAVFSGGFIPLANHVKEELGLDYAFANSLGTEVDATTGKEVLNGEALGDIVDGTRKRELLNLIADQNSIPLEYSSATGDGANDLLMMKAAGFGIAWNAKPKVQSEAPGCLNSGSLADSLYIYGYNDAEIKKVLG